MSLHTYNHVGNNLSTKLSPSMQSKVMLTICMISLLFSSVLLANPERKANNNDKKTENTKSYPVNISADELVSQTKGGQSEYKGNVVLTRNKLEAHGSNLLILHPNDKLKTATLTGNLSKFKDFLPKKQEWVNGEAKQIIFDQEKDTVTLKDDAFVITDKGNQIRAEQIILYNKTETFEAIGNKKHGTRVQMVIQPEN